MTRPYHLARLLLTILALFGCVASGVGCGGPLVTKVQKGAVAPRASARWAVLPFANHSDTPQAGERVEAMASTVLRARGIGTIDLYPAPKNDDASLVTNDHARIEEAMAWARQQKYDFVVTGSVEEWRYKAGIDAEPAIGITMRVVEVATGKVLFSASGTKTGRAAENASGTALTLLDVLIGHLDLG